MIQLTTIWGLKKEEQDAFNEVAKNSLGNPVILEEVPTSKDELKANTIAKVKDTNDFVYIRFGDGALVKVAIDSVIT